MTRFGCEALMLLMVCAGICWCTEARAQGMVEVSGVVLSSEDGLPVIGVAVIADPTNATTTSIR